MNLENTYENSSRLLGGLMKSLLFCERVESVCECETKPENIYKEEGKQGKIDKGVEKKKRQPTLNLYAE